MIHLKLDDFPMLKEESWGDYSKYLFSLDENPYKGFKDFLEKNYNVITTGNIVDGINLYFDSNEDAVFFKLRWT